MKNFVTLLFIFVFSLVGYGQEICDNAIDDDADGLIDLNDDDCDCEGFGGVIASLIPNPSFEDRTCCPVSFSQLYCANSWNQASDATSDYFSTCGTFDYYPVGLPPTMPLPGEPGGEGFAGFILWRDWAPDPAYYAEYIGSEGLLSPLLAGVSYTMNLYTARSTGDATIEFSLFGTPNVADMPWSGYECPTGIGSWELLADQTVTYAMDGSWQEITLTFTPSVDINAIALGGPCTIGGSGTLGYYYVDELTLIDSESFSDISESGSLCDNDLILTASTDTTGGSWQWYKDGIALLGETGATVDVDTYGLGDYSAVYTIGDNCQRSDHTVSDLEGITADFDFTPICLGDEMDFSNTSVYGGGVDPTWAWDFGDGGTSTTENPSHTYGTAGTFTVELIAFNDAGCNDTIEIEVTVDPLPVADFEFVIGGVSSEDGLTGGCIESTVQFNDLSTIAAPGVITSWSWNFGDAGTSTLENPTHLYSAAGTYTVTLTVETDNGCSSTYTLDIIMSESLTLDLIYNEPTCFGYTDGSVTVNVTGGGGELTFVITDADGTVLNIDNSNTANTLGTGWYYIDVTDATSCAGIDSVFLDQPGQLDIDLTTNNVLCNGLETGWARVDNVINFTGDYADISYFWNPNPAGVNGVGADSTWSLGAGNYTLTINDENGCSNVFDFEITEPTPIVVTIDTRPALCRTFGYQSGNGVVYGDVSGGVADYTYLWTDLTTGETTPNTTWGGRNPGNYQFTVTDNNGCVVNNTVFLDSLNPEAIFSVNSAQLNGDLQGTAPVQVEFINESINFAHDGDPLSDTTFFWSLDRPTNGWYITHNYYEIMDTTYEARGQTYQIEVCLIAFNKNNCSDTACKIITIYEPIKFTDINIFSPNGDGKNDVFTFEFRSASISEFECIIVNRWGVVIAELTSITDGWDGTDKNGDRVKDGVYFYTYKALTDDSTTLEGQGNIQVVGEKE